MSDNNRWAVRDIRHGKTYFFRNWSDLKKFVLDESPAKPVVISSDDKEKSRVHKS